MSWKTKLISAAIGLGLALSVGLSATPAQARFFVGFGFGYPGFYRPYPVFYRPYLLPPPPPPVIVARPAFTGPATPKHANFIFFESGARNSLTIGPSPSRPAFLKSRRSVIPP